MVTEGTPAIFITFVMAIVGYVGLTCVVLLTVRDRSWIGLWRVVALIIFAHVVMVWMFRYNWQFDLAVRNGYTGFLIFHSALVSIVVSAFCNRDLGKKLIHISFLIVTMGAVGASFRYDVVAMYRVVVIGCGLMGGLLLVQFYVFKRRFEPLSQIDTNS
jgi:hypothetical protein